jgi:protein STU2
MKGAVGDSNVAAQQEGLGALCELLREGPTLAASRTRGATIPIILEKGIPSTRGGVKQNALEALMLYVEVDRPDQVVEEFVPMFTHKLPKVIAANLNALTSLYHVFGVKIVDPKPVLKNFPKLFAHADKNVRVEATKLAVELYRWLKNAMKPPFWGEIKDLQQKELEKEFEAVNHEAPPQQERLIRSQQAAIAVPQDAALGEDAPPEELAEEEDFADLGWEAAPEVDVLAKMPGDFSERMASTKWKDRKDALDELHRVANVARIKEGSYDEVVSLLAKSMKDANIMVVIGAANCVEDLAKGLKRSFAKYKGRILNPMLERLKEKKQSVADALGAALDAVFQTTSLSECLEGILEFLKHKNPQVKQETMRFLIRCLRTTREVPSQGEVKGIAEVSTKLMTESVETIRNGGAEAFGTLMKIMGEKETAQYMESLDDIRKAKVKEYFDAAVVKAKAKPKPKAKAAPARAPAAAQKKPLAKKTTAAPAVKMPAPKPSTPEPAPSPSKTTTRPVAGSKLNGPGKPGLAPPGSKLGFQKRLGGGAGGSAASSVPTSGTVSPQRRVSPQTQDEAASTPAAPRIGLGRGLAGRSLAKPSAPPSAPPPAAPSGPSALEIAELEDLRAEKDRLLSFNDELRKEKAEADIEINELRTHEAELIEERTRNRLTIKAKETQLVRARSDAEVAEESVARQQREIERLKRELGRAVRGQLHSPPPPGEDGILADAASARRERGSSGAITPRDVDRYESNRASREVGYQRARSYMTSPSEEKENGLAAKGVGGGMGGGNALSRTGSGASTGLNRTGSGAGHASAASPTRRQREQDGDPAGATAQDGQPIESWRRAAEVTSQLKARIEMMKVSEFASG